MANHIRKLISSVKNSRESIEFGDDTLSASFEDGIRTPDQSSSSSQAPGTRHSLFEISSSFDRSKTSGNSTLGGDAPKIDIRIDSKAQSHIRAMYDIYALSIQYVLENAGKNFDKKAEKAELDDICKIKCILAPACEKAEETLSEKSDIDILTIVYLIETMSDAKAAIDEVLAKTNMRYTSNGKKQINEFSRIRQTAVMGFIQLLQTTLGEACDVYLRERGQLDKVPLRQCDVAKVRKDSCHFREKTAKEMHYKMNSKEKDQHEGTANNKIYYHKDLPAIVEDTNRKLLGTLEDVDKVEMISVREAVISLKYAESAIPEESRASVTYFIINNIKDLRSKLMSYILFAQVEYIECN